MLVLKQRLQDGGVAISDLAQETGLSRSAMSQIVNHDHWPASRPRGVIQNTVRIYLMRRGIDSAGVFEVVKEEAALCSSTTPPGAAPTTSPAGDATTGVDMLIRKTGLSPAARAFFNITDDPFAPPETLPQVFMGPGLRVAYEHMLVKAKHGGFIAIVGESGSGKTTLKETLIEAMAESSTVTVMEPMVVGMEQKGRAGTSLNAAHIAEAMLRELAPLQAIKRSAEARLNQLRDTLAAARAADRNARHLLVIEEAHRMPLPTLRYMKNFMELTPRNSRLRLLSIILLGQPELAQRLSSFDMDVREVWQRCELARLDALDKRTLGDYVKHRLGRAAGAFEPAAIDALHSVLTSPDGRSFAYPLAVDNWAAACLNEAAGIGARSIGAEIVAETKRNLEQQKKAGW